MAKKNPRDWHTQIITANQAVSTSIMLHPGFRKIASGMAAQITWTTIRAINFSERRV